MLSYEKQIWISRFVVEQMRPSIYGAIEQMRMVDLLTNEKKKKKTVPSVIITSILVALTDATPDSRSCNSFALSVLFLFPSKIQEKEVPESVEI